MNSKINDNDINSPLLPLADDPDMQEILSTISDILTRVFSDIENITKNFHNKE